MISQHGDPKPPDFQAWADEWCELMDWQNELHTNPAHPARDWDDDQRAAYVDRTWPLQAQMRTWVAWHDQQPARQGPRLQLRGKTITRSLIWVAVYIALLAVATANLVLAVTNTDNLAVVVNGVIIGVAGMGLAQRLVGLHWQIRETAPDAPTNAQMDEIRYQEALATGKIKEQGW